MPFPVVLSHPFILYLGRIRVILGPERIKTENFFILNTV